MFDKFEVLMSWKLSSDISFLLLGVSDGHIFFVFSNYCPCLFVWIDWASKSWLLVSDMHYVSFLGIPQCQALAAKIWKWFLGISGLLFCFWILSSTASHPRPLLSNDPQASAESELVVTFMKYLELSKIMHVVQKSQLKSKKVWKDATIFYFCRQVWQLS